MSEIPFPKGSYEANRVAKWIEDEITVLHTALEHAEDEKQMFKIQGMIAKCRAQVSALTISDAEQAEANASENIELENQPIIPV